MDTVGIEFVPRVAEEFGFEMDKIEKHVRKNQALIEADGKPRKLNFSYEERELGEPDGMSAIMDWVCYYTYTIEYTVVRHRHSPARILVTLAECVNVTSGEWHYEENSGYDAWEARQIAEAEQEYKEAS